ncbi:DUF6445 family protein [Pseudomonas sp. EA_65y_Pfl2_P74]|uniref:DUF6445 family protein n=1 Tax=Pseudomonas sp. EA_65y_Pfl2_P74 TaxID=3088694 RepID=UPI0030D88501
MNFRSPPPPLPQALYFDDFYRDVDKIRALALAEKYKSVAGEFKGEEFRSNQINVQATMDRIASLLGEPIVFTASQQGRFRTLTAAQEQTKNRQVHVDQMGFAGVICLNPDNIGSTSFYCHRLTGASSIDTIDSIATKLGISRSDLSLLLESDCADLTKWEKIGSIEYRYNRLIIFDTNYFHVASPGRGNTRLNTKLTQNFNFYFHRQLNLFARAIQGSQSRSLNAPQV